MRGHWTFPAVGRITSPFGPRVLAGAISNFHHGVDVGCRRDPVFCAQDGVVRAIFRTPKGAWVVDVRHEDEGGREIRTRYVHMFRHEIRVGVGERVRAGQQLGNSGASGTGAAHLHLEVLVGGTLKDPQTFLSERGVRLGPVPVVEDGPVLFAAPSASPATMSSSPEEDEMLTDEEANQLAHAVAMATEARNLAAHVISVLAGLPTTTARAVMWDTTVARSVDGVDTRIPVIQEIADTKTVVLGLDKVQLPAPDVDEVALAAALAPLIAQSAHVMSDDELDRIAAAVADEQQRRLAE